MPEKKWTDPTAKKWTDPTSTDNWEGGAAIHPPTSTASLVANAQERVMHPIQTQPWIKDAVLPMVLSTAGAGAAAPLGAGILGKVGPMVARSLGAGLGMAGGEALNDVSKGQMPDLARMNQAAALGLGGELTGLSAGKLINKMRTPLGNALTKAAVEAEEVFDKIMPKVKAKFGVLPGEATEGTILSGFTDWFEGIVSGGIGSKGIWERYKLDRIKAVYDAISQTAQSFTNTFLSRNKLGNAIVEAAGKNFQIAKAPAVALRKTVEDTMTQAGAKVDVKPLHQYITKNKDNIKVLQQYGNDSILSELLETFTTNQPKGARITAIPYDKAVEIHSRLARAARQIESGMKAANAASGTAAKFNATPGSVAAHQVRGLLTNSMKKSMNGVDPALVGMWDQANQIFKSTYDIYKTQFLQQVVKQVTQKNAGRAAVNQIARAAPDQIANIRTALNPASKEWSQMQRFMMEDIAAKSMVDGVMNPQRFAKLVNGEGMTEFGGYGKDVLKEFFGPSEQADFQKLAKALQVIQSNAGAQAGTYAIQGSQFQKLTQPIQYGMGAAFGIAGAAGAIDPSTATIGATVVLGGPIVLAKLFTNPVTRKLLIRHTVASPGTEVFMATGARLAALAGGMDAADQAYQLAPDDKLKEHKIQSTPQGVTLQPRNWTQPQ